jgi:hypothetical protein
MNPEELTSGTGELLLMNIRKRFDNIAFVADAFTYE